MEKKQRKHSETVRGKKMFVFKHCHKSMLTICVLVTLVKLSQMLFTSFINKSFLFLFFV